MEEFNKEIIQLMCETNIWKESYNIEFNSEPSGQSLTFFIKENEEKLYIAKFFNYMQGLSDDRLECLGIEAETIEEFENKLADNTTTLNVEEILECIYLSKRSFNRYIEVCINTEGLFPKLYAFKNNIKIGKRFYGLLIEEFVKGISLTDEIKIVKRNEIDIYDYAINFLVKISNTIKRYTDYGFVHRDISPDNIIVTSNKPVIIDPGFIKIIDRNSTRLGYMLGKDYYASPEQYKGLAVNVDFSSDLYSIGIILYEIVTGKNLLYRYMVIEKSSNPHEEIIKNFDRTIEDEFFKFAEQETAKNILLFNMIKKMLQVDRKLRFYDINAFNDAVSLLKGGR